MCVPDPNYTPTYFGGHTLADLIANWSPIVLLIFAAFLIMRISAKKTNQFVKNEAELMQESIRLLKEISQKLDNR